MPNELDPRLVRIGIEVNGRIKDYEGLDIHARGMKFANPNENECEVTIANIDKATMDFILTETSPFNKNRTPKKLIVEAGRESYGYTQIYIGNITASTVSQPPDITVTMKSLTGNYKKGDVVSRSAGSVARLSTIAKGVADDLHVALVFQASDRNISNYSFTGGALKQINQLQDMGNVDAYLDNETLVVKDRNVPLANQVRILNMDTGMIGIPEVTEHGIKVTALIDNQTVIGGALRIESKLYPALNGLYTIYKLGFEIASRDTPFYFIPECKRIGA